MYVIVPDPETAAHVNFSQASLLDGVQEHAGPPLTVRVPDPPLGGTVPDAGVRLMLQLEPDCVTVNTCPLIAIVPTRCAGPGLAETVNASVALLLPERAEVICIQPTLLIARHAQVAVISSDPTVRAAGTVNAFVASATLHPTEDCVMRKICFPIRIVPERLVDPVFSSTEYVSVPSPLPDGVFVSLIHDTVETAFQSHESDAMIVILPLSPADAMVALTGEIVISHEKPG